ncbi:hypothetical protein NGM37_41550, partial [Streptomyces sp. TRM76130]|nr:hypothetical protein [Streptomyces sp. TRM76130]
MTFDAASDHRTLTATGPDGRTRGYDLRRPDGDGNGFYAALSLALGGNGQPDQLASRVSASRELPTDAPLDPEATFRLRELELRAGLAGPRNAAKRAAVEAAGGRLPDAVRDALTPFQRERLVRLHLRQGRRWDSATADLAASTTARTLGVNLTVVGEDGSHRRFPAG